MAISKKQFLKTMQDPFTHELIAFGWSDTNKTVYTVREAIAYSSASIQIQEECLEVFGAEYADLVSALLQFADLDKEYDPIDVFAKRMKESHYE